MPKTPPNAKADNQRRLAASTQTADPATSIGFQPGRGGPTEDEKRALGIDAGADAGDHDDSPEANRSGGTEGGLYDSYGPGQVVEHANVVGPTADLVLGQAPVVSARPMPGAGADGETFKWNVPNAINRSPVVRGVTKDPRNDPAHPDFTNADKAHPDYGKPANQHRGVRSIGPTFEEVATPMDDPSPSADASREKAEAGAE